MEPFVEIDSPVVPRTRHQLGILVLDGSPSMTELVSNAAGASMSKAAAVNDAVRGMFGRFKVARNAPNFSFAAVAFGQSAEEMMPLTDLMTPTRTNEIDENAEYDPTAHADTNGTFVGAGLAHAAMIARDFLARANPELMPTVVVLVMSDGECGSPEQTARIAEELKSDDRVKVATSFFATKGRASQGDALLRSIASDPVRFFKTVYDAETLRNFFMASMSAAAAPQLMPAGDRV